MGLNPLYLGMSVTLACSFAFMLPMGTPPNMLVYSRHYFSQTEMVEILIVLKFRFWSEFFDWIFELFWYFVGEMWYWIKCDCNEFISDRNQHLRVLLLQFGSHAWMGYKKTGRSRSPQWNPLLIILFMITCTCRSFIFMSFSANAHNFPLFHNFFHFYSYSSLSHSNGTNFYYSELNKFITIRLNYNFWLLVKSP